MTNWSTPIHRKRVRLTCDLTEYNSRLVAGSLGWTGRNGQWGVIVNYDCGASLDTLWRSLEVLEDETKAEELRVAQDGVETEIRGLLELGADPAELRKLVTKLHKEVQSKLRRQARQAKKTGSLNAT